MTTPSNEPPPPELFEATWTGEQVETLFSDLDEHAEIERVQVRSAGSAGGRPEDRACTLEEARSMLRNREARAIQIYYRFDGAFWCDTLFPANDSIRIVRTTVPDDRWAR